MSLSSTGSLGELAVSRASSARACAVWPHAHALRAAAKLRAARCAVSGGQRRRAFVGSQRRRVRAATLGTRPDELERRDDLGVRSLGGCGAMPRLPVGVAETGQGVR